MRMNPGHIGALLSQHHFIVAFIRMDSTIVFMPYIFKSTQETITNIHDYNETCNTWEHIQALEINGIHGLFGLKYKNIFVYEMDYIGGNDFWKQALVLYMQQLPEHVHEIWVDRGLFLPDSGFCSQCPFEMVGTDSFAATVGLLEMDVYQRKQAYQDK